MPEIQYINFIAQNIFALMDWKRVPSPGFLEVLSFNENIPIKYKQVKCELQVKDISVSKSPYRTHNLLSNQALVNRISFSLCGRQWVVRVICSYSRFKGNYRDWRKSMKSAETLWPELLREILWFEKSMSNISFHDDPSETVRHKIH